MGASAVLSGFLKEPFNRTLFLALLLLGAALLVLEYSAPEEEAGEGLQIHYFYSPQCSYCEKQEPFNRLLEQEFDNITIISHNAAIPEKARLLLIMAQDFGMGPESLATPATFIGNQAFIGFISEETTGKEIREAVARCLETGCAPSPEVESPDLLELTKEIDLPLFGKTDLSSLSLPALAMILGAVDGFNPCAMWVLVYLIGLLMNVNDKRKLVLVVGVFLLASGILYFLFMTAWLNAFLLLGYIRPVTIMVGLVALGGGILSIKEYIDTKGAMVCKASDAEGKTKMMDDMRRLVESPLTWATFLGLVALAFAVNSLEFVCSAAIPAVFTQVLALSGLSALEHYGYILLYVVSFMLDDLLIFGSALLIVRNVGESYARYCKIVGGAVMLILGFMLLFAPGFLG